MNLQHVAVLQNKIDLVKDRDAVRQHDAIQAYLHDKLPAAAADTIPVIPISAQLRLNMDAGMCGCAGVGWTVGG